MGARPRYASSLELRVGIGACLASIAMGPGVMLACLILGRLFSVGKDIGIVLFGVCFCAHCISMCACVFALLYTRRGWWLLAIMSASYNSWFLSRFISV